MAPRTEQRLIAVSTAVYALVLAGGVLCIGALPLWTVGVAIVLVVAPLAALVVHGAGRPSAAGLRSGTPTLVAAHGRGPHFLVREARDTLLGLLDVDGGVTPTFERMVAWYREVTDEMGCRAAFEAMLLALPAGDRGPLRGSVSAGAPSAGEREEEAAVP
jgi:hypothetical protein